VAAFVATVLVECGLAMLFRSKQLVRVVFICNLLTNPLLNFILMLYSSYIGHSGYWMLVVCLEVGVVVAEAFVIRWLMKYTSLKALTLAVLFNGCSFAAGLLIILI